jgi:tetratricopeptide (TPR) repeat protein
MCFLSMARWVLGETKAAVDCIERGIRYSEQLSHPFSLAQAVVALSLLHTLARDYPKARESAARGMRLAERYSFAEMLSESRFYYAAAQTARRDSRRADAMLAAALRHEETAAGNYRPLLLTLCAEAYSATGDFTRALELLAEAEAATTRSAERWAEAEMLRVRAELLAGMSRLDEAENTFDAAISVSQEQSAKSWELRAVIGRTRLLMDRKRTDGLTALRDLRRRFAYDRTSPDGIAADRLLGTSAL